MINKEIEELLKGMRDVSNTEGCSMNLDRYLVKLLLSYIEQLEKKVDQYENPEDLTLFYMWLDTKAKDKMKQLENNRDKAIEYNEHLIEHAKYHLNLGHLKKMRKILKGDSDEFRNN